MDVGKATIRPTLGFHVPGLLCDLERLLLVLEHLVVQTQPAVGGREALADERLDLWSPGMCRYVQVCLGKYV